MKNRLNILKQAMIPIVNTCLKLHDGGEEYFTELDGMIKQNDEFMISYLFYAIEKEDVKGIFTSGEIGTRLLYLQEHGKIPSDIQLITVNGGLRKNSEIKFAIKQSTCYYDKSKYIFFDDSYYSGKTANAVCKFAKSKGCKIVRNYVFYDGSREVNDKVFSLYRYY